MRQTRRNRVQLSLFGYVAVAAIAAPLVHAQSVGGTVVTTPGSGTLVRGNAPMVTGPKTIGDSGIPAIGQNSVLDARKFVTDNGLADDDTANLQAALDYAKTNGIGTVACGARVLRIDNNLIIPDFVRLDCGAVEVGKVSTTREYRVSSGIMGVLALSPSANIVCGSASELSFANVERHGDAYAPTTFKAETERDGVNSQTAQAGTAIFATGASCHVRHVAILGFDLGVNVGAQQVDLDDVIISARRCVLFDGAEAIARFEITCKSLLTQGLDLIGDMKYAGDVGDGSHQYEITWDVTPNQAALQNADTFYAVPDPNGGAQSIAGPHQIANVHTNANGVKGCTRSAGCLGFTLVGTSTQPTTLAATWSTSRDPAGYYWLFFTPNTGGNLAKNQTLSDGGGCLAGLRVKDVWNDTNRGRASLTGKPGCSGNNANVSFSDDPFTAGNYAFWDVTGQPGAGIECFRSSGIKNGFSIVYSHFYQMHFGEGCRGFHVALLTTGTNDSGLDDSAAAVLIDGNHQGNDANSIWLTECNCGQHINVGIKLATDSVKPNFIGSTFVTPGTSRISGVALQVESGTVMVQGLNSGGATANIMIADGATYTNVFADPKNLGSNYHAGDVLTAVSGSGGLACTTLPQLTIDTTTNSSGVPKSWHQSRSGVCSSWPTGGTAFAATGGAGSGLMLLIDGFIPSDVRGNLIRNKGSDFYMETPGGPAFSGTNNDCVVEWVCNHLQTLDVDTLTSHQQPIVSGLPGTNYLANPGPEVWQENTSYTPPLSTAAFIADGFKVFRNLAANYTVSRVAGLNGGRYAVQLQRNNGTSDTGQIKIGRPVFSSIAGYLAGKQATFSADVSVCAGFTPPTTFAFLLASGQGINETFNLNSEVFPTGNTTTNVGNVTVPVGTLQRISFTTTVPSGATEVFAYLKTGSFSGTAGASDCVVVGNVKLEPGSVATPFSPPTFVQALQDAQYTYQKSFSYGTVPAQNVNPDTGETQFSAVGLTTSYYVRFPQPMWSTPTITLYNPSHPNAGCRDETGGSDSSSATATNVTEKGFTVTCTFASISAGNKIGIHWSADKRL